MNCARSCLLKKRSRFSDVLPEPLAASAATSRVTNALPREPSPWTMTWNSLSGFACALWRSVGVTNAS